MRRPWVHCVCVLWLAFQVLSDPVPAGAEDDLYDRFYDDDTTHTLNFLPGPINVQVHNFWQPGDADWVKFHALPDCAYTIRVTDQASSCDAIIYLYHASDLTTTVVPPRDDFGPGISVEEINWFSVTTSGTMFVKITQSPKTPGVWGLGTTYTLRFTHDWGDNAGLGTISGTTRRFIGPGGGTLRVSQGYEYTKHQVDFPPGALDREYEFVIGTPEDIGLWTADHYTTAWMAERPGNASIVWIRVSAQPPIQSPIALRSDTVITVQFIDDGPTTNGFTVDDLPAGADPSSLRIHTWTGSSWRVLDGQHWVAEDTVSTFIRELGTLGSWDGHFRMNLFAVAPVEATADARSWALYR